MGFVREIWGTLHALVALVRRFFVRWFLPVHGDEEPEKNDRWEFDDEIETRRIPEIGKDEPVKGEPEPVGYDMDDPQPMVPVIAPPAEADERVARGAASAPPDYIAPEDDPSLDTSPDTLSLDDASSPSEPDETNPFTHDKPTEHS